ncbi:DUF1552 domain-containing protein [Rubellicoccus peritrichatus]|uniref:DUF1552 domain-containing protein n=1 Tax=Rubellicoccus peritrichatus TaxID=3080537 RepID=A0AAQ3LA10_9BACT|nr:DUF1552 domain-containing protein [Puniceicoccus sp. CR14]WOO41856.1 DUF1552 domain-containing protein [Puniceicoccus sp. CR14]
MKAKQNNNSLPRRAFLRATGAAVALPLLQSWPTRLAAETLTPTPLAMTPDGRPLRLAFVYHPNGVIMPNWRPEKIGQLSKLPVSLEPFEKVKDSLTVVSGLKHDKARANGDGAGDHARANGTFLTGVQLKKTGGKDIRAGISIDQMIARQLQDVTPLPSLELSCSNQRRSGSCDSGYSCAYQYNLSWRAPDSPNTPEVNPRDAFARLFGAADPTGQSRLKERWNRRQSVLDSVSDDTRRLYREVSVEERGKLDAYFESIRAVERRISAQQATPELPDDFNPPAGIPSSYAEYLDVMYDIMALAFETDATRVVTFLQAHDGSGRKFPELGISEGHHQLSHHQKEAAKIEKLKLIDRFYTEAFGRFLERMADTPEGPGGSLLDSSVIIYGGGISDGNRHNHDDLPVLLAGKGGGLLKGERHVQYNNEPMCNLYLDLAKRMGVELPRFGDSTEHLRML